MSCISYSTTFHRPSASANNFVEQSFSWFGRLLLFFLQANFPSLEALIARIKQDGKVAEAALDGAPFAAFAKDAYLTSLVESSG